MTSAATPFMVRTVSKDDATSLIGLMEELGFPTTVDELAHRLDDYLQSGEMAFIGTRDGEVLGLVTVNITQMLHRSMPVGRLTALVVASGTRGQGLGRALVAAAEQYLKEAGCGLMEVTSNRVLTQAHGFYERLGYELTSYRFRKPLA